MMIWVLTAIGVISSMGKVDIHTTTMAFTTAEVCLEAANKINAGTYIGYDQVSARCEEVKVQ